MKFCWCTLSVKNMEDSVRFYRDIVGLPVIRRYKPNDSMELAFLGEGETQVELIAGRPCPDAKGAGVSLGFEVKSLDDMIDFINEHEIQITNGPIQPSPRIKFFYIKDPDGYTVQFVENISAK